MTIKLQDMDKIIEKKTGWRVSFTKKALPYWLGALLLVLVVYLIARPNNKTLRVDKDSFTVATAHSCRSGIPLSWYLCISQYL